MAGIVKVPTESGNPWHSTSSGRFAHKPVEREATAEEIASQARRAAGLEDEDLHQKCVAFHRETRTLPYEKADVYDEDGKLIKKYTGRKSHILFSDWDVEHFRNATMIHNHPSGSFLSDDDLAFALRWDLHRMIAANAEGYYTATIKEYYGSRSSQQRNMAGDFISRIWDQWDQSAYRKFRPQVTGGIMTAREAQLHHYYMMFEKMSEDTRVQKYMDITFTRWED